MLKWLTIAISLIFIVLMLIAPLIVKGCTPNG